PGQYDAATTVTVDIDGFELVKEELTIFPNPTSDYMKVTLTNAPCGVYVLELVGLNGSIHHSQIYDDFDLQNGIIINVANYETGQYVLRMVYGNKTVSQKIMVQ
ncbi:MAG: T9SS type A sorting domain-containing protein, partial [Mariniphaga sp.]|nr:T9SS type A sorting domain-containing protein [Mariniphaga sp.]